MSRLPRGHLTGASDVSWSYGGLADGNDYPLVMSKSLLKMTIEIVDLPIDSMVMFHSFL